jgi:hypothetical protein
MKSKSFDVKRINFTKLKSKKQETLRELQLTLLNSLAKSPLINLTKNTKKKFPQDFDDYISKMDDSLNKYQLTFVNKEEIGENEIGPNEKYMTKDDAKLIKKIYDKNKINNSKELSSKNEESNLKIIVSEPDYPNPFQSLGVIKHNNHIFNEISKDYLYRQSDLFNRQIINIQKYEKKHKIKMPKISVGSSNVGFEIPVVDLTDKKTKDISSSLPHIPQNGNLKLLAYYKYPNKNFPEGREQFSLFLRNNEIFISGGISSNMKSLAIWSLNLEKLEWKKLQTNGLMANRYGHTGVIFQNKMIFFGGKTKYLNMSYLCGLEMYTMSDYSFNSPSVGKLSPETRKNHIAELLGNQMFIHGGLNEANEILNDCYLLTLNTLKWNICSISKYTPAPKLYGHASCIVIPHTLLFHHKFTIYSYPNLEPGKVSNLIKEKGIYIFGGKSKEEGGLSNQLWILITGKKPMEWVQPETKGKPPSPRYFHSMNYYEKGNFLIIHGGRNDNMSESCALNDTYIFDLENFDWIKIILYSQLPGFKVLNRCGHQSVIYGNKLIIVGGMNNNNYLGSTLFIINLDFSYQTQPKTLEEITIKQLEEKDDYESHKKIMKIKNDLRKSQLGVVTNITLPSIK